ncbi:MAG: elongation factor G [Candidatus Latescibacterota bacterium]|nr:MAG: elongation factor G [Candidatus Latescibacterota bacterium]
MNKVPVEKIRNLALLGHQDTGKTSFLEAVMLETKVTNRLGRVDDGNSNLDFIPEEIERRISVRSKLVAAEWDGYRMHFVDAPGYDDFVADRMGAIAAVETALLFASSDADLEPGTERAWRALELLNKPRIIIVNKMDREHADFDRVVQQLRQRLSHNVVPLLLPIGHGTAFKGVVDVVEGKAWMLAKGSAPKEGAVPDDMAAAVAQAREELMNAAAETSDELVEKFLESGELSQEEFHMGLSRGIATGSVYPVVAACGGEGLGVATILDVVRRFAPSPADVGEVTGTLPGGSDPVSRAAVASAPLAALAFGALSEANVGDYVYVRVFSGSMSQGMDVVNSTNGDSERIGPVFLLNGKQRVDHEAIGAGEIGAAVKLKHTHISNTLCDRGSPIVLPFADIPEPLAHIAIKTRAKGDEDKLSNGLGRLHEEDVGFRVQVNPETHQTILMAQGDTHVAVLLAKLKRKFGVEVDTEPPRTPYRETIRGKSEERYRHKKQTGGRGQFGEVNLLLEPLPRGGGFEFVNAVVGGVIPTKFIPAVEKGVREAMSDGPMAGFPVVDVKVTVNDGKFHAVDSSEAAFKMAAAQAFKAAFPKAKPVLLEPIYKVVVRVPEEYMGDVMGDMSSRRGRIQGMGQEGPYQVVRAEVPLASLYEYATVLRSLTQGRAAHERDFSHYEEVPREIADTIIAEHKAAAQAQS